MTDRFDYRDPNGLDLELDLPSTPLARAASKAPVKAHADDFSELPQEFQELPEELTAPFVEAASEHPESQAWALELEDIAPPAAAPLSAPVPRTQPAVRAAAQMRLPQRSLPQHLKPARTLELRIAQSVDRMSPMARAGLLALTVVTMLLLAVSVLMGGVRSAQHAADQLREAAQAGEQSPLGPDPYVGDDEDADPYERYRVDDQLELDDDGHHRPGQH